MMGLLESARLSHHNVAVNVDADDGGLIKVSKQDFRITLSPSVLMPVMVGLLKSARLLYHHVAVNIDADDGGFNKVSKAFASH